MIRRRQGSLGGVMIAAAFLAAAIEARLPATPGQTTRPVVSQLPPQGRAGSSGGMTWDFETGNLAGWQAVGTAFASQPTFGDNSLARKSHSANQQGRYWIGTFESYQGPGRGKPGDSQGDRPQGTLTSNPFTIPPTLTFRIGGGSTSQTRVELMVFEQIEGESRVMSISGKDSETMQDAFWDLSKWAGRQGRIRIVDASSGPWGHINVDDFRFGRPNRGVDTFVTPTPVTSGRGRRGGTADGPVKMVTVPDLAESTEQEARDRLNKAGLTVGDVTRAESSVKPGTVFKQTHEPFMQVVAGTPVGFTIGIPISVTPGRGRGGRPTEPPVKMVTVPDLVGSTDQEARDRLANASLKVGEVTKAEANEKPGTVFKQDRASGTQVAAGTAVGFVVAVPITVVVPNLFGATDQEARDRLSGAGLSVGEVTKAEANEKPGTVFKQDRAPDTQVAAGTAVGFVVAVPITVVVPSVVGNTESDAVTLLKKNNLRPGTIKSGQSRSAKGQVIAQGTAPGVRVPSGSAVDLTIAVPITVGVPPLRQLTQPDAVAALKNAELAVGDVSTRESRETAGTVLTQRPAAGTVVDIGTPVSFVLATPVTVEVPPLVNRSEDDAMALLKKLELNAGNVTSEESRRTPGTVLSQQPAAGTRVTIGSAVGFVTARPVTVIVPNVVSIPEADARQALVGAELAIGSAKTEEARVPPGSVLRQSVPAGTRVTIGTVVDLVTATPVTVLVPKMVGIKETDARQALSAAELQAGLQYEESSAVRDIVLAQSIDAGSRVPIGTLVNIVVATTVTVAMPAVLGMPIEQARQALVASRLVVGSEQPRAVRAESRGTVLAQSVDAGGRIPIGTAIVLTFATPELVPVPQVVDRSHDDAVATVTLAGLTVGPVVRRLSFKRGGTILRQGIPAGLRVEFGTAVAVDEALPRYVWMAPSATVLAVAGLVAMRKRKPNGAPGAPPPNAPVPIPPVDVSAKANIHIGEARVDRDDKQAIRVEVRITPIAGPGSQEVTATSGNIISSERRVREGDAPTKEWTL